MDSAADRNILMDRSGNIPLVAQVLLGLPNIIPHLLRCGVLLHHPFVVTYTHYEESTWIGICNGERRGPNRFVGLLK